MTVNFSIFNIFQCVFPLLNLVRKANFLVSLRCIWPRPIDISSLFLIVNSAKTPVALLGCWGFVLRSMVKCWYSELAISKSGVIQGSVNISDMLAIFACSGVHFLTILVVCYLIHSLDSTHVVFFTIRLVLRVFRFSLFQFQVFWRVNLL